MWKDCIEGYEISSSGEVRNKETKRVLKHEKNSKGLLRITIRKKHYLLHRLMAVVFIPNPNGLPEVIFKTPDKEDIRASNLMWAKKGKECTQRTAKDRRIGNTKLTEGMVRVIKSGTKLKPKVLAHMYNVSISTIYALRKGKNSKRFDECVTETQ